MAALRIPLGRTAGLSSPAPLLRLSSSKPKSRVNFRGKETCRLLRRDEEPWELTVAQGSRLRRAQGARVFLNAVDAEKTTVQGHGEWA